jgi:hypothetical protein
MHRCSSLSGFALAYGRAVFCMQLSRVHTSSVSGPLCHGYSGVDLSVGWPQTLAVYFLIQTIGGDLGMASMSSIVRSIAKSGIRSSLGNSEATEQVSEFNASFSKEMG